MKATFIRRPPEPHLASNIYLHIAIVLRHFILLRNYKSFCLRRNLCRLGARFRGDDVTAFSRSAFRSIAKC